VRCDGSAVAAGRNAEAEIVDDGVVAVSLGEVFDVDAMVADRYLGTGVVVGGSGT